MTAHPPSAVYSTLKCSFISDSNANNGNDVDVVIAKSNILEVRRYREPSSIGGSSSSPSSAEGDVGAPSKNNISGAPSNATNNATDDNNDDLFPLLLTLPINGRIISMIPIRFNGATKDCIFLLTEKGMYTLISYDESLTTGTYSTSSSSDGGAGRGSDDNNNNATIPTGEHYPIKTHAVGSYKSNTGTSSLAGANIIAGGKDCECGPQIAIDTYNRCIAIHSYDGYITVIPINGGYSVDDAKRVPWRRNNNASGKGAKAAAENDNALAGGSGKPRGLSTGPFLDPFHVRIEERTVMSLTFLEESSSSSSKKATYYIPQLAMLHMDSRGYQHVISHGIDLQHKKLIRNVHCKNVGSSPASVRYSMDGGGGVGGMGGMKPAASNGMPPNSDQLYVRGVEGGSGCIISVPPPSVDKSSMGSSSSKATLGGVIVLGQHAVTYYTGREKKAFDDIKGGALLLSQCRVLESSPDNENDSIIRYLVGDERGSVYLMSLNRDNNGDETKDELKLGVLGKATTSSSMVYLGKGHVLIGSSFGNSQLIKILESPVALAPAVSAEGDEGTIKEGEDSSSPLADTTYIEVLEEYDNLGPIVDFDLRPCSDDHDSNSSSKVEGGKYRQSLVVTCSGVGKDGTVRLIRNGVGMREHAAVDIEGIKGMWSLRRKFHDVDDTFMVQSFVRETRILGVQSTKDMENDDEMEESSQMEEESDEEEGGALAEVTIDGFNSSKSTLFAGNLLVGKFDLLLQVVEDGVRLVDSATLALITSWSPFSDEGSDNDDEEDGPMGFITVASANESGQIVVALRGGALVYLLVKEGDSSSSTPVIRRVRKVTLDREISCIDLNPFGSTTSNTANCGDGMEVDSDKPARETKRSQLVAVGLWDDFSVRLLNLGDNSSKALEQVLHINLGRGNNEASSQLTNAESDEQLGDSGQHMMARSLCLVTMDSQSTSNKSINQNAILSSSSVPGSDVNMLLVGLGDGKLISFVVRQPGTYSSNNWSIHSRKEVSLGTQGVHLVPFRHTSGSCVLATGDRPTVVYLTGGHAGSNSNPKLNYSTISLTVDDDEDDEEEGHASHKNIAVNVAAPFQSSLLFSSTNANSSSLCVADENCLRLGMIDNIQKLHVTSYKLGMTPRRIAYHEAGRVYCVGCIGSSDIGGEINQRNCVRFFDDSTFEEMNHW